MLWILASLALALLCYEIPTLVAAVLWPLWNNPNALQTDFHYYYEAAHRFAGGGPLYLATDDVIAGFTYPPPAIVPFLALSKWPLGAAFLLLTLASYAALIVAIRFWCAYLRRQEMVIAPSTEVAVTLIALALGPSYMNIMIGQVNAFVLVSMVGFVTFTPFLPAIAALMLALGIWLKVYPIALGALGTWDRRSWRALGLTMVALVAIAIGLLPIVPVATYQSFFAEVLPSRRDTTAIHITNQSVVAFLERFRYPPHQFLYWTGEQAVTVSLLARTASWGVVGGALLWLWTCARHGRQAFSAAGLIALIAVVAPLGWGHTYVMALPLIILRLIALGTAPPGTAAAIVLCVLAFMLPASRHLPVDWAPGSLQNLVYSRYLVATLVLSLLDLDKRPRRA